MKAIRFWTRLLLWVHLFVCCVWFYLMQEFSRPQMWMIHILVWSILVVQFTWGLTVGMMVGPSRSRRPWLWLSLLTISMPLYFVGSLLKIILLLMGPIYAAAYLAIFTSVLASETFAGVMLGVKLNAKGRDEEL